MVKPDLFSHKRLITNSITALVMGILVFLAFYRLPRIYIYMIAEDSYGEYFTFAGYFVSMVLIVLAALADREHRKPLLFILAAGFFIMAMEEISWAQRIFGFGTRTASISSTTRGSSTSTTWFM